MDSLMRATNHLKLAQAEFERARKQIVQKTEQSNEKSPSQLSFLLRANANINDAHADQNNLCLHAQPTAYQDANDHNALLAQEPGSNISSFYDDPNDLEEHKEGTAHFGDQLPLRIPSGKISSPENVHRTNSSDNPPIMQMLRLHKQLSGQKYPRESSLEFGGLGTMKNDELFAAQVQMNELNARNLHQAE